METSSSTPECSTLSTSHTALEEWRKTSKFGSWGDGVEEWSKLGSKLRRSGGRVEEQQRAPVHYMKHVAHRSGEQRVGE
eukprot:3124618-Rhodomonas_salina.1